MSGDRCIMYSESGVIDPLCVCTCERLVMPKRKQMASRMLLLPLPLRPVMALNRGSNPVISVRWA